MRGARVRLGWAYGTGLKVGRVLIPVARQFLCQGLPRAARARPGGAPRTCAAPPTVPPAHPHCNPHPSAVDLPAVDFPLWDSLGWTLASQRLSRLQVEGVLHACARHAQWLPSGERAGFFLGDGAGGWGGRGGVGGWLERADAACSLATKPRPPPHLPLFPGVGKGRQIAAIMHDSLMRGRERHVWVSTSADLHLDAARDLAAVGCQAPVVPGLQTLDKGGGRGAGVMFRWGGWMVLVGAVRWGGEGVDRRLKRLRAAPGAHPLTPGLRGLECQ